MADQACNKVENRIVLHIADVIVCLLPKDILQKQKGEWLKSIPADNCKFVNDDNLTFGRECVSKQIKITFDHKNGHHSVELPSWLQNDDDVEFFDVVIAYLLMKCNSLFEQMSHCEDDKFISDKVEAFFTEHLTNIISIAKSEDS